MSIEEELSTYNAGNFNMQGGEVSVFKGEAVFFGDVVFMDGCDIQGLPVAANQADSTATTVANLVTDFNALLAKLRAAGLMEDED